MIEKLMSAFIGEGGEIMALTDKSCYCYKKMLSEDKAKILLKKLAKADSIDTVYWVKEWDFVDVEIVKKDE